MPFDPDAYLASKQQAQPQTPAGGFDPDAYLAQKDPSLGQRAKSLLGTVAGGAAKVMDSVTGAPTRAAIYAAQQGQNPISAALHQFGNLHDEPPSGKDIAAKAGLSPEQKPPMMLGKAGRAPTTLSDAGIVGSAIDMAANPMNFAGPAAKALGKGAEALGEMAPVAKGLESFANEKALKAAGAMTKDFRMIQDKGMQDALGSYLLDHKLVTPLATVSKVAERIADAKKAAGETIGHILDTADIGHTVKINARDMALALSYDPEIEALSKVPGKEATANQVNGFLNTLYKNGENLTLREAQKLRQGIDDSINFNKRVPEMSGAQPYLYKMRDALSKSMNDAINAHDTVMGLVTTQRLLPAPASAAATDASAAMGLNRLKEANDAYSKLATLDRIAQNRVGALSSNRSIGLTDTIAGAAGTAMGHTPLGKAGMAAAAAVANKAGRTFGPSVMATSANKAAKAVKAAPGLLQSPAAQGLLPAAGAAAELGKPAQGLIRTPAGDKKK